MRKLHGLGWLLIFTCFAAYAQQGKEYSFTHYTTNDGLASNFVRSRLADALIRSLITKLKQAEYYKLFKV